MNPFTIVQDGEAYLSLEVVAELYQVDVVVLREVYDRGLFGPGVSHGALVCIATYRLDVVATIARLHQVYGLDSKAIAARLLER